MKYYEAAILGELYITDSGCYSGGFTLDLPSHGRCFFEYAVWYRGEHRAR